MSPASSEPKPKLEKWKGWRLDVDLFDGLDFFVDFETPEEATHEAEEIVKRGYVVQDRSKDRSNYELTMYPVHRIRSLSIRQKAPRV